MSATRIFQGEIEKTRVEVDDVDWQSARVSKIIEIRAIWFQPLQLGASVDCRDIMVYPDAGSGFDEIDDDSEEN